MKNWGTLEEALNEIPRIQATAWNFNDLTGKKFGSLTPIYYGYNENGARNHNRVWVCLCDCGQYTGVEGGKLTGGQQTCCSPQCPYRRTKKHNLLNKKFGRLTVVEEYSNSNDGHSRWKCMCECGNITVVEGRYLENERIYSCGNCPDRIKSIGNLKIKEYLIKHNVNFVSEYRFKDCRSKIPLPFDFCILDKDNHIKLLIEYNGDLHYKATGGWITSSHLEAQQSRDEIKKQYCLDNNYNLLIIHYKDISNIESILKEVL